MVAKISVSLPQDLMAFIDYYQIDHKTHNRSDVIKDALMVLRERELEPAYAAANVEIEMDFDNCSADGLDDDRAW
jgi:metal-responsive CopG/Arc/MetJ family transcriptional regulator